jgi:hypothetical protein
MYVSHNADTIYFGPNGPSSGEYSERKAHGEHTYEHTKGDKYKIAAHKKKWKKHQTERKVIIIKNNI